MPLPLGHTRSSSRAFRWVSTASYVIQTRAWWMQRPELLLRTPPASHTHPHHQADGGPAAGERRRLAARFIKQTKSCCDPSDAKPPHPLGNKVTQIQALIWDYGV